MEETQLKQHFHLVSGEVVFLHADESIGNIRLNAVLRTPSENVAARNIGEAQQALQMIFHKKVDEQNPMKVVDVFIIGISYLGRMTEQEFQKPPEGTKLEEKTEAAPVAGSPVDSRFEVN